jgi:hypothetical protein
MGTASSPEAARFCRPEPPPAFAVPRVSTLFSVGGLIIDHGIDALPGHPEGSLADLLGHVAP